MTDLNRDPSLRPMRRPVRLTLLGLWAERIVRTAWPLWSILIATAAFLMLGLQDVLPIEAVWGALVAAVAGGFLAAVHMLRSFAAPTVEDALARLDDRLPGRPIAALRDTQAVGSADPASRAVWAAHQRRMADRAAAAQPVAPDLRLARRDPFALRYVALTFLALALLFGSVWRIGTAPAVLPGGGAQAAMGPAWEGWAQPPLYTGKPSIYLNELDRTALDLPVGSRLQFRLYGDVGQLTLTETVSGRTDPPAASDAAQDFTVTRSGEVVIAGDGGRTWTITVIPDQPPTITPAGEIGREGTGEFTYAFDAADDYGVAAGQVTIALDLPAVDRRFGLAMEPEAREPVVLDLPLPRTGDRTGFSETLIDDLSEHPFANLPVTLTFQAVDDADQTGTAAPVAAVLPGKRFFDPLAAALIEMRRDLLWNRANAPRVVQILKAVTYRPEDLIRNERAFLRLRVLMRQLDAEKRSLTAESRDAMAAELWAIALMVEEGDLQSALDRLQRAQDRLDEAIRNGASPEEIQRLMDEMQQALTEYMRELAEQAQRDGETDAPSQVPGMQMSANELQQMFEELQRLMEEGRMAEAQQLMEQLRQFMENMQVAQGQPGDGGPGNPQMGQLQDMLREQQDLSDETFQDLQGNGDQPQQGQQGQGQQGQPGQQGQGQQGQQGQPGQQGPQGPQGQGRQPGQGEQPGEGQGMQPGQQGQGGQGFGQNRQPGQGRQPGQDRNGGQPDDRSLSERQRDLQRQLDQLGQGQLPGDGTAQGEAGRRALEDAERAMRDAERALRDGDMNGALDRQADAMEAMREGLQNFGEALAQEQRQRQPGQQGQGEAFGQADPGSPLDPLGREPGDAARIGSDRNMLQGEDVYRRAQDLLDEIRRRSGEQLRPEAERDYLRRLLDLF